MAREIEPTPIRKSMVVKADQQRAFSVFTRRMHAWSPTVQSLLGDRVDIVLEPRSGGRWYEVSSQGKEADWGKVIEWEPPGRLLLGWQLDADFRYDPGLITEVEVLFRAEGPAMTRIELEHRNLDRFGSRAADVFASLDSNGGWTGSMALLEKLLEGTD